MGFVSGWVRTMALTTFSKVSGIGGITFGGWPCGFFCFGISISTSTLRHAVAAGEEIQLLVAHRRVIPPAIRATARCGFREPANQGCQEGCQEERKSIDAQDHGGDIMDLSQVEEEIGQKDPQQPLHIHRAKGAPSLHHIARICRT